MDLPLFLTVPNPVQNHILKILPKILKTSLNPIAVSSNSLTEIPPVPHDELSPLFAMSQ